MNKKTRDIIITIAVILVIIAICGAFVYFKFIKKDYYYSERDRKHMANTINVLEDYLDGKITNDEAKERMDMITTQMEDNVDDIVLPLQISNTNLSIALCADSKYISDDSKKNSIKKLESDLDMYKEQYKQLKEKH